MLEHQIWAYNLLSLDKELCVDYKELYSLYTDLLDVYAQQNLLELESSRRNSGETLSKLSVLINSSYKSTFFRTNKGLLTSISKWDLNASCSRTYYWFQYLIVIVFWNFYQLIRASFTLV